MTQTPAPYRSGPYGFIGEERFQLGPLSGSSAHLVAAWHGGFANEVGLHIREGRQRSLLVCIGLGLLLAVWVYLRDDPQLADMVCWASSWHSSG